MSLIKLAHTFALASCLYVAFPSTTGALTVTVPGSANPWLAGAANGTTASSGDEAPAQSPVLVQLVEVDAGDLLRFYVSGMAGYAPGSETTSDGVGGSSFWEMTHSMENGIGGINNAPANALIGVFLDDSTPAAGSEPTSLDFSVSSGIRDAGSQSPGLKQPFFIGNGVGAGSVRQTFAVPTGATRLYLGTLDGSGWFNNPGQFTVNITINGEGGTNTVSWGTPTLISQPSDVITGGSLVLAKTLLNAGVLAGNNQDVTVNGVPFTEARDISYGGVGNALFELSSGYPWDGDFGSASTPFSNLDSSYQTLLKTGILRLGANASLRSFQLTLNGLTIGDTYDVQFWVNGSYTGASTANHNTVITTSSGSVTLDPNTTGTDGGIGQWVTASFVANEPGITFEFTSDNASGFGTLNAFQVRSSSATPEITDTELPAPGNSFTVTGGTAPYTFEVISGSMPQGLLLSSDGMISGSPTASSSGAVMIRVTDSASAVGGKIFNYTFDIGRPEIALRRVVIQDVGGTNRMGIFEVTANDDVALAPYESDTLITNASHAFEYRFKSGAGTFFTWETALYFPFNYPPAIPFDTVEDLRVEFRSIDAAGNRSRTLAYDIKKGALPTADQSFGVSVAAATTTLIPNAGASIIKMFVEESGSGSSSVKVTTVDRDTGKISAVYNSNRSNPANSPKNSITLGTAVIDAAAGRLMPPTTGKNDGIMDFVVATASGLKIVVNKSGAAPSLAEHSVSLPVDGAVKKVAVGDVNGDGADDIVAIVLKTTGPQLGHFLAVYLSQATANSTNGAFTTSGFSSPTYDMIPLVLDARALTAGDLNGDGAADVVFAYRDVVSSTEKVLVYKGTPGGALVSPAAPLFVTNPDNDEEIVDLKIADYSGHVAGQKDIIVGIIGDPDTLYPSVTHVVKHRVLVGQIGGAFKMAPTRRLATISQTLTDKNVFNIAVGHLSDRVMPDIVSCQFDGVSPAGAIDSGFLPPANATGELNWMLGNDNGVQTFGTISGKPRRIELADLTGNALPDVILANSDNGNIELLANQKPLLVALPPKVLAAPALTVPVLTALTPGGASPFATRGIAGRPWTFSYAIGKPPADIIARVEYQLNYGPWTTLPGGTLGRSGTNFTATVPSVPVGLLRFRCWATSASQSAAGVYDSYSLPSQAVRSIGAPHLAASIESFPDSDPQFNKFTHDDEFITFYINYRNDGVTDAQNVVVAAAIPLQTVFTDRPSGTSHSPGFLLDNTDPAKATVVSWNIGTLAPGTNTNRFFSVKVKPTAMAALKGKPIVINQVADATKSNPPTTADLFKKHLSSTKSFGVYSSAPGASFKPILASAGNAQVYVLPPLTVKQTLSGDRVGPGQLVTVSMEVKNYGPTTINNITVSDTLEDFFSLEGVRPRAPANAPSGNFIGTLDPNPDASTNPKYEIGASGRVLTWNIGSLAPGDACTMEYQLRLRYDVDSESIRNGVLAENDVEFSSFNAVGVTSTNKPITAQTKLYPKLLAGVDAVASSARPQLSFQMDCVPLSGTDPNTASEPSYRQTIRVGNEDMAVLAEGGIFRTKLNYRNTSPTPARHCSISYEVPDNAEMLGFFRRNSIADSLASNYTFFGPSGIIPVANLGTEMKKVRRMIIRLGDVAGNSSGSVDFILAAYSPPIPKATNEKPTPAKSFIASKTMFIESDSLKNPAQGTPWQVPVYIMRPVSFEIETRPDKPNLIANGADQDVTFTITFRNTGSNTAQGTKMRATVPVGTTLVSSDFDGSPGTVLSNGQVEFDIGTMTGAALASAAPEETAQMVVRIPAVRPANFPKDGRLRQRVEIIGRDSVTNKSSIGTYRLFSAIAADKTTVQTAASEGLVNVTVPLLNLSYARLVTSKHLPTIVRPGQVYPIKLTAGNTGSAALTNVTVAMQIPFGTDLVTAGTTPWSKKEANNIYRWNLGNLNAHSAQIVVIMLRVRNVPAHEGKFISENSAVAEGTFNGVKQTNAPGRAVQLVLSTNPFASAWQWWGASQSAIGSTVSGSVVILDTAVSNLSSETTLHCVNGADCIVLPNGALIMQLGGGNIVAAGGGNIVAAGGGNIVAAGGGNIVAAGAGNAINVATVGALSTANLQSVAAGIVSGGAGNIIAAGAGNLLANDGGGLLANDGGSFTPGSLAQAGVVAGGAGNFTVTGSGIVAAGAGNFTGNSLKSSRNGAVMVPTSAGFIRVSSLLANDGGGLLGNDGGGLIANDGAGLLGNDGGGLVIRVNGAEIVAGGAGN